MSRRIRCAVVLGLLLGVGLAAAAAVGPAAAAGPPQASYTDIEGQLMCVTCHTPLSVAESPQAYAERALVRRLIAEGLTRRQILDQMVAQYGDAVLALPKAKGFNLVVYILPPAVVLAGLALLARVIPRWRRQASARREAERAASAATGGGHGRSGPGAGGPGGAELTPEDAERLEAELTRFGR